ncbi:MAG: (d)CMP kinase [Buchnera aphidicola (Meitanaphis microgallis)]
MKQRDYRDSNRIVSPLIPPKNAITIDSSYMSEKQVINLCMEHIKNSRTLVK